MEVHVTIVCYRYIKFVIIGYIHFDYRHNVLQQIITFICFLRVFSVPEAPTKLLELKIRIFCQFNIYCNHLAVGRTVNICLKQLFLVKANQS